MNRWSAGRNNRDGEGLDTTSVALLIQQNTQVQADVAAMRVDMAKVATQLAALPDMEARLRVIEQRPSTSDLESRVRLLERWRYSLPASVIVSVGSAAASLVALFHR